jgi:hypothetical protein
VLPTALSLAIITQCPGTSTANDLKSSHVDSKVNNQFLQWLKNTYASDDIGHVKAVCGNHHNYLAMILDFLIPGMLQVDMTRTSSP